MTTNHTPTPWAYLRNTDKPGGTIYSPFGIGNVIIASTPADTKHAGASAKDIDDNAAHIVRCVNSHDALVEALQEMISIVEVEIDEEIDARAYRLEAARAALRAATGE